MLSTLYHESQELNDRLMRMVISCDLNDSLLSDNTCKPNIWGQLNFKFIIKMSYPGSKLNKRRAILLHWWSMSTVEWHFNLSPKFNFDCFFVDFMENPSSSHIQILLILINNPLLSNPKVGFMTYTTNYSHFVIIRKLSQDDWASSTLCWE